MKRLLLLFVVLFAVPMFAQFYPGQSCWQCDGYSVGNPECYRMPGSPGYSWCDVGTTPGVEEYNHCIVPHGADCGSNCDYSLGDCDLPFYPPGRTISQRLSTPPPDPRNFQLMAEALARHLTADEMAAFQERVSASDRKPRTVFAMYLAETQRVTQLAAIERRLERERRKKAALRQLW